MEDKELKKRLKKVPDADKDGEPIYKIDNITSGKKEGKSIKKDNKPWDTKQKTDSLKQVACLLFGIEKNRFVTKGTSANK